MYRLRPAKYVKNEFNNILCNVDSQGRKYAVIKYRTVLHDIKVIHNVIAAFIICTNFDILINGKKIYKEKEFIDTIIRSSKKTDSSYYYLMMMKFNEHTIGVNFINAPYSDKVKCKSILSLKLFTERFDNLKVFRLNDYICD